MQSQDFQNSDFDSVDVESVRWSWVEIDTNKLRNNFYAVRNCVKPNIKIMAVVKADAYGHGAVRSAKLFESCGADYFGVATVAEGVELRRNGIQKPILILSQPPASSISYLLDFNLMPSIYETEFAIQYGEAAVGRDASAPFHLAINTGMNRIGVDGEALDDFVSLISFHKALETCGVFTHFATADESDTLEFDRQVNKFSVAVNALKASGINPGIVHCANSASILKYPNVHFDMVRAGIILYGLKPSADVELGSSFSPAMSVRARITDVRSVPLGEGVSYGLVYRSRGYAKVCTIPVGYADGLHRCLSGRIEVILRGKKHMQVGRICMDQCMFEVSQRTLYGKNTIEPFVGDVVTLVGEQQGALITLDELAEKAGTINYELACNFGSMRLKRVYV